MDSLQILECAVDISTGCWAKPSLEAEQFRTFPLYNTRYPSLRGRALIERIKNQGRRISRVCTVEQDILNRSSKETTKKRPAKRRKGALQKDTRNEDIADAARKVDLAVSARSFLNVPTTHRLLEFPISSLEMFGHPCHVSELPCEHTHQRLKRSIGKSNNKEVHLFAMQDVSFNDWLSRLRLAVRGTISGETSSRSHFLSLTLLNFSPGLSPPLHPEVYNNFFRDVIGPFPCVQHLLEKSPSLFTERQEVPLNPQWVCSSPFGESHSFSDRFESVSNALLHLIPRFISTQFFSAVSLQSQLPNHKIFRVGDTIAIPTYKKKDSSSPTLVLESVPQISALYESGLPIEGKLLTISYIIRHQITKNSSSIHIAGHLCDIVPPDSATSGNSNDPVDTSPDFDPSFTNPHILFRTTEHVAVLPMSSTITKLLRIPASIDIDALDDVLSPPPPNSKFHLLGTRLGYPPHSG